MILTKEERTKFVAYLRQSAESDDMIARQMEAISLPEAVVRDRRAKAAACAVVAAMLESTDDV